MQPGFSQSAGRVLAAGTHADYDHICMLWLAHEVSYLQKVALCKNPRWLLSAPCAGCSRRPKGLHSQPEFLHNAKVPYVGTKLTSRTRRIVAVF
jgi:hypothetical protein